MKKNIHAIIIARGGSKGISNKNITNFCGKPLIFWTIKHCLESQHIKEVWVSSDSDEILDLARSYNLKTIKRPLEFANDTSSSEDAWLHAIEYIGNLNQEIDLIVAPQVTSPLRESNDFDNAIDLFYDNGYDSLFSASIADDLFIWKASDNNDSPVSINYDFKSRKRRQDFQEQFVENGSFYIFSPSLIKNLENRLGGKVGCYLMPLWKMFEIDSLDDIKLCSVIMNEFILKG